MSVLISLCKIFLTKENPMSHRASLLSNARLLKLTPVVSFALLCAAMPGVLPAEDKLDKKAVEIVKKVGDLYKNAKTLHTDGTLVANIDNDGKKQEIKVTAVYDVERPNRLSLKTTLDGDAKKGPDVITDGKKLTVYRKALGQYVQEDAPKEMGELGPRLLQTGPVAVGILFPNVLTDDPASSLMEGVNSCSYVGTDKVDGTPAHHMKFSQDQFDWEMWVATEGKPFVLRMTRTAGGDDGKIAASETYKNWALDAPIKNDTFTFSAPKDAKKVDDFKEAN
jgi:hypothetical protein